MLTFHNLSPLTFILVQFGPHFQWKSMVLEYISWSYFVYSSCTALPSVCEQITLRRTSTEGMCWWDSTGKCFEIFFILVSPCPSVRPFVDRVVSALYLPQYSPDPFYFYTSYQSTLEGVLHIKVFQNWKIWSFGKFFKFVNLTLSCFDFGSNMNWWIVWVIMGRRGYPQNAGVLVVLVLFSNVIPHEVSYEIELQESAIHTESLLVFVAGRTRLRNSMKLLCDMRMTTQIYTTM